MAVPFPFGIGDGCFLPGFEIDCINGVTPTLANNSFNIKVMNLTVMPQPQARVMLPVAFQCYDTTTGAALDFFSGTVNISSVYRISNTSNELVVLGCNTLAYTTAGLVNRKWYTFFSGCLNYCFNNTIATDGACAGIGCCRTDIPPGLTDNSMTFYAATAQAQSTGFLSHMGMQYSPCDYAFMVEKNTYDFQVSDLNMNGSSTTKQLVLDWAIRNTEVGNVSCAEVTNKPGYACLSKNSTCLNSPNGPGYFCNCTEGYWGNPYIIGGCQGKTNPSFQFVAPSINSADRHTVDPLISDHHADIDECDFPEKYTCNGVCSNRDGDYDCTCPSGQQSENAKLHDCTDKFSLAAKLALGTHTCSILHFLIPAMLS
jgi:hypothetical protein